MQGYQLIALSIHLVCLQHVGRDAACRAGLSVTDDSCMYLCDFYVALVSSSEGNSVNTEPHIRRGTVREVSDSALQEVKGNCIFTEFLEEKKKNKECV